MAWAPDYLEPDELEDYVRVDDDVDAVQVAWAIGGASRAVDNACGRQFGRVDTPEERLYTPHWDVLRCSWVIDIDDLATVVGATIGGVSVATASLYPRNAVAKGKVWTRLLVDSSDEQAVTASWGWPAFPVSVLQATALQASRLLARRDSPFGVAGSPQQGSELRLLAKLDADLVTTVAPYVRLAGPR